MKSIVADMQIGAALLLSKEVHRLAKSHQRNCNISFLAKHIPHQPLLRSRWEKIFATIVEIRRQRKNDQIIARIYLGACMQTQK